MSREVEVQLKHLVSDEWRWSENARVRQHRVWSVAAVRPGTDDDPGGSGAITCGDCDAVVAYRLWTVDRTRRHRRIRGGLALAAVAAAVGSVVLLVQGSLGNWGFLAPPLATGAAFGLAAAYAAVQGVHADKVRRHQVVVVDTPDDPYR